MSYWRVVLTKFCPYVTDKDKKFPASNALTEYTEGGIVAKIYWVEEGRVSEKDILKRVKEVAEQDEAVRGHVPTLFLSKTFTGLSTSTIRKALGLKDPTKGSRTLFLLVFKKRVNEFESMKVGNVPEYER
ncbi:hypothetical protein BU15DRAFT_77119 [Melanogaster broomeanus]|nr:hypothetical protein BU15DRAFT_77119 [Melanogaster broomeanus]